MTARRTPPSAPLPSECDPPPDAVHPRRYPDPQTLCDARPATPEESAEFRRLASQTRPLNPHPGEDRVKRLAHQLAKAEATLHGWPATRAARASQAPHGQPKAPRVLSRSLGPPGAEMRLPFPVLPIDHPAVRGLTTLVVLPLTRTVADRDEDIGVAS